MSTVRLKLSRRDSRRELDEECFSFDDEEWCLDERFSLSDDDECFEEPLSLSFEDRWDEDEDFS
jgi:hypothetical protein